MGWWGGREGEGRGEQEKKIISLGGEATVANVIR